MEPQEQLRRKRRALLAAALGIGGLSLIGGCGWIITTSIRASSEAKEPAERFLTHLEKQEWQSAHAMLTSATQTKATVTTLKDMLGLVTKKTGPLTQHTGPVKYYVGSGPGRSSIQLTYRLKGEKGESSARLQLIRESGEWRIAGFHFGL
jgi:hypothetical protein